jgi:hypothetical protein
MSASVKIDVNKVFEVHLLERPYLSTKDLFYKKNLVGRLSFMRGSQFFFTNVMGSLDQFFWKTGPER